jgi:hypothetical protein
LVEIVGAGINRRDQGGDMRCYLHWLLATALLAGSLSLHAQEPVVGASDPDALFHSSDPQLNTNKQAALFRMRLVVRKWLALKKSGNSLAAFG